MGRPEPGYIQTAALLPLGDSGVHPTPSFLPLPHKGIASENLSGLLSLFGENKKGGKEALYMHLRVRVYPHTHILNKVISVTDTICLGPPDFRVGCGSWGLRKPGLCRKKQRWAGVEAPSTWPWKPSPLPFPISQHCTTIHIYPPLPPLSQGQCPAHLVTWESPGIPSPHVVFSSPCWLWIIRFIHVFIRVCI